MTSSMGPELQKTFENTRDYEMKQQLKEMFQPKASKECLDVLSINIIISGLPADYNQFVHSYQMNGKETSIMELYSLVQTAEQGIKKSDVPSTSIAPVLTRLNLRLHLQVIQRKQCASTATQRGIRSVAAQSIKRTSKTERSKRVVTQGIKESRRLKHGELNLVIGNRKITPVTRIGMELG
ncbi:hypothetical protein Tco_0439070 [Tanacetum coccineum]